MYRQIDCPPSPHFDNRAPGSKVNFLIFHYTACNVQTALRLFQGADPNHRVSAHYMIDENGDVYSLVEEYYRAWHAGKSFWGGLEDLNSHSVGIELVNPGQGPDYHPFPPSQMDSLLTLSREILERHPIPATHVLGHSDIAPHRKIDPGPLFEWRWLAERGVGLYPSFSISKKSQVRLQEVQQLLHQYGYDISITNQWDDQTQRVLQAFQWHYGLPSPSNFVLSTYKQVLSQLVDDNFNYINKYL